MGTQRFALAGNTGKSGGKMMTKAETAREIYITGLRNQHAIENQAVELLERQLGRLENYPEMAARMRSHLQESKDQGRRIEELLAGLNTSHSTLKDMVTSFMGNVAAIGHATASDEVIKNTLANYAFEHYEIAAYQALLAVAEVAGEQSAMSLLVQSLKEEQAMAQWISDHLKPTMLTYVERYEAGETAGR
jgi:ferritin-like metal-binding protein YciE